MRRLAACLALLVAVPLLLPYPAVGQGRPAKKKLKQEVATPEDYAAVRKMKEISGVVTSFDAAEKTVTLKVDYNTYEVVPPRPGQQNPADRQMQALLKQQQALAKEAQVIQRIRNPIQQQQRLAAYQIRLQQFQLQVAAAQAQGPKVNTKTIAHTKELDFDFVPEPKVARANLPMEYDDKGKVKEYTEAEKKKLRSPDLAGYTAKFEDLEPGQTVKLYLAKPKPAKKKNDPAAKKPAEGDSRDGAAKKVEDPVKKADAQPKETADEKKTEGVKTPGTKIGENDKADTPERPIVRMVLILTEADPAAASSAKGKRKKKDQ